MVGSLLQSPITVTVADVITEPEVIGGSSELWTFTFGKKLGWRWH